MVKDLGSSAANDDAVDGGAAAGDGAPRSPNAWCCTRSAASAEDADDGDRRLYGSATLDGLDMGVGDGGPIGRVQNSLNLAGRKTNKATKNKSETTAGAKQTHECLQRKENDVAIPPSTSHSDTQALRRRHMASPTDTTDFSPNVFKGKFTPNRLRAIMASVSPGRTSLKVVVLLLVAGVSIYILGASSGGCGRKKCGGVRRSRCRVLRPSHFNCCPGRCFRCCLLCSGMTAVQ